MRSSPKRAFSLLSNQILYSTHACSGIPDVAEAILRAKFAFGRTYGAVLLMNKPTTSRLEETHHLICPENDGHLRNKQLVTEIVTCPAYAMFLSSKSTCQSTLFAKHFLIATVTGEETVGFALYAKAPVAAAVGVTAGGGVDMEWVRDGSTGVFRCGSTPGAQYTTLYKAVTIGKKRMKRREPPETIEDHEIIEKDWFVEYSFLYGA